jgi:hypothetical protein
MASHEIHLRWLSDVFVIPKAGLFTTIFSMGDTSMLLGLFRLIQANMRDRNTTNSPSTHHID